MKKLFPWFLPVLLLGIFVLSAMGETLTAKQIITRSKQACLTKSSINKLKMSLINKRNEKREIKMLSRGKSVNGLSRTQTTFLFPDEVKGTKFLMIENANREADMMIFIPDLGRVRTISSTQRNQSYMGSDFAYGDLEALDAEKGAHVLKPDGDYNGQPCWVIETTFKPSDGVGYSRMIDWFRKTDFAPVKTEFYDKDGALKKVKTIPEIYLQNGVLILKKMIMQDMQTNHQTIIEIIESQQQNVEDFYFTVQFMQQTDRL
jgi:hypothetical protein